MTTVKALVIGHSTTASLRRIGPWFGQAGLDYELVFGGAGLPSSLEGYSALIVLGGAPLPNEDDRFPWLVQTRALTSQALERGIPMLGICLGGQLLAYVGGGLVEHRKLRPEHGMTTITLESAARHDPLFIALPRRFSMTENHVDHITSLPDQAVLLAHSDRAPVQAFRMGDCAWGLQFHPEVAAENIVDWDAEEQRSVEADGFVWADIVRHAREAGAENARLAQRLATRFAAICVEKASTR
ncbi:type 1 glutamine amidotransferase [Bifidobacterium sp.]|jgi:GMP synthase-like glutamine amidotransferase|uniref:type 1 glutamine amidotransferase n=1 Tax=Bifidobacterium sp. TaxID=41200 RepID=UPI0025C6F5D0|nr:type 1 glutamine amidotransferase [Bifidobacterium sp.]MCH4209344.1 type 1 glutamine amidotransferase [Bifidobacterium sp.]MCI1224138.1 type 1 glutamine amidotransferase [Bifidobacterium sp.]